MFLTALQDAMRAVRGTLPSWQHAGLLLLWLFGGLCLPLLVLGSLAEEVWERDSFSWDEPILYFIHQKATPLGDAFFVWCTQLGRAWILVPVCTLLSVYLLYRKLPLQALFFAVATFGAMLLTLPSKALFERPRPALWVTLTPETTLSFPSGHATSSMAVAVALTVVAWPTRWRWLAIALGAAYTFCVGLSRLYLGVHFPSDVVAGWCAGLSWVLGVRTILHVHERRYLRLAREWMLRFSRERHTAK